VGKVIQKCTRCPSKEQMGDWYRTEVQMKKGHRAIHKHSMRRNQLRTRREDESSMVGFVVDPMAPLRAVADDGEEAGNEVDDDDDDNDDEMEVVNLGVADEDEMVMVVVVDVVLDCRDGVV